MKVILILMISIAGLWFWNTKTGHNGKKGNNIVSLQNDSINYKSQVQPILEKKCSPCHFPGGKMYERMPFDKSETITTHEAGVLKRFKEGGDLNLIKQYLAQTRMPHNL